MRKSKGRSERPVGPALCEWNDHGMTCGHLGVLSPGTAGGPWYCRQHFYQLRGYPDADQFRGNDGPFAALHSFAVDEIQKRMAEAKQREPGEEG